MEVMFIFFTFITSKLTDWYLKDTNSQKQHMWQATKQCIVQVMNESLKWSCYLTAIHSFEVAGLINVKVIFKQIQIFLKHMIEQWNFWHARAVVVVFCLSHLKSHVVLPKLRLDWIPLPGLGGLQQTTPKEIQSSCHYPEKASAQWRLKVLGKLIRSY